MEKNKTNKKHFLKYDDSIDKNCGLKPIWVIQVTPEMYYVLSFFKISDYFTRANKHSSGKVKNMKPEYPSNGSSMFWSHLAFKISGFGPFLSI